MGDGGVVGGISLTDGGLGGVGVDGVLVDLWKYVTVGFFRGVPRDEGGRTGVAE